MQRELATATLLEWAAKGAHHANKTSGLSSLEWAILRCIQRLPVGRRQASQIATYLNAPKNSVSRALRQMQSRGLLKAAPSERDKRGKLFTLTSNGMTTSRRDPIMRLAKAIEQLPHEEREGFERSVRVMAFCLVGELGGQDEETSSSGR